MSADENDLKRRMDGALDALKREFGGLRTGRASTSLLENVQVDCYGSGMPMNQVASVSVPEPRMLSVQVWDNGNIKAVEKAIIDSELGLNPQTEGNLIRVPIPELSEERREEMTKVAAKYAEQARIAVRNVRRDGMDSLKKLEKDGEISQDEHRARGDDIQQMTDGHISNIDTLLETKEQEIMQV
ncbi:MAG: ribosome recycling factor [Rhodospirillaceae bacterium]|nr:ribosome recycling factor [Rhodospirillaceae bacterium]MBT5945912.1 ribosome recycling factor [Rhodospirillaceae bacterium]MBT6403190.1 ribosome recycling factor [Rhodospirillaceae bacterium]MBT6534769.1 ribosome recycling factor [Rhodospirillaceae bacterium]